MDVGHQSLGFGVLVLGGVCDMAFYVLFDL